VIGFSDDPELRAAPERASSKRADNPTGATPKDKSLAPGQPVKVERSFASNTLTGELVA